MTILRNIALIYYIIRLLINPNENIKSLIIVGDRIGSMKTSQLAVKKLFRIPKIRTMYRNREGLDQLRLDSLSAYPKDSLGHKVYLFYTENGLDVYPQKDRTDLTFEEYISERIRKIHDVLHVVLGYGTDLVGEAKVNAFVAYQSRMPMSFLIVTGIIIKYFFQHPTKFQFLIDEIVEGWSRGSMQDNFLLQDWDQLLSCRYEEVVRQYSKPNQLPLATAQ